MQLALNPAVQEDGKYTDKQKEQLKEANDAISKKRQEVFKNMGGPRGNRGAAKGANNNANGKGAAKGKGAANTNGGAANTNGGADNANGNAQDPTGGNPNAGGGGFGGGAGFGGAPPDPEAMQAAMEKMQKAMAAIQKQTDEALKKILKKEQIARLSEIDLRRQGPMAVFRDDIAQKLGISEEQMVMMQEVRNDMRTGQREARKGQGAVQRAIRDQMQAAGIDTNAPPAAADPNAPAQKGGGGRNRGPNREAQEKFLASNPELKKQMDEAQKASDQVQDQAIAAIGEVLTKSQKNKFNKMLGKPFDVDKLRNPGGPGGPPAATDATAKKDETAKEDAAKTSSAKKPTTKKTTKKKSAA